MSGMNWEWEEVRLVGCSGFWRGKIKEWGRKALKGGGGGWMEKACVIIIK